MIFQNTAQRLIVAVDLKVDEDDETGVVVQAENYLCHICDLLSPLGVTIKVNTIARILGARALEYIHERELGSFLDLKLLDIANTLENECAWIRNYDPLILTVAERVKSEAFDSVIRALPNSLVLPVDPLTDLTDGDFQQYGYVGRDDAVVQFFQRLWQHKRSGTICAPTDIRLAPSGFRSNAIFVTPAVKPAWSLEDNNSANALTPAMAVRAGAQAIVVGRGITAQADVLGAAKRTLAELQEALAAE